MTERRTKPGWTWRIAMLTALLIALNAGRLIACVADCNGGSAVTIDQPLPTPTPTPSRAIATITPTWTVTRTATATGTSTVTATATATPQVVRIVVGSAVGIPGSDVDITVSLVTAGVSVAATGNDIEFDSIATVLPPTDCHINPALQKVLVVTPLSEGNGAATYRFFVQSPQNTVPIPDGPLYTCRFHILPNARPEDDELYSSDPLAFSPAGGAVPLVDTTSGDLTISLVPLACVGDCNGDQIVFINEIIDCANVALGNVSLAACPACSSNGVDVEITDLITAVQNALNGCPSAPH